MSDSETVVKIAHISDLHFVSRKAMIVDAAGVFGGIAAGGVITYLCMKFPRLRKDIVKLFNSIRHTESDTEDISDRVEWENLAAILPAAVLTGFQALYLGAQMVQLRNDSVAHLQALYEHFKQDPPDLIVISGDLSNVAHPDEFALALAYIEQLEAIVGQGKVFIIPGNHDADTGLVSRGMLTKANRQFKLKNYLQSFQRFHGPEEQRLFPTIKRFGDISLIGLDTTASKFWMQGRVDQDQLGQAMDLLHTSEYRETYKIVVSHHHLTDRPKRTDQNSDLVAQLSSMTTPGFSDAALIRQFCKELNIEQVLHGHVHSMYSIQDRPQQDCAGSTPLGNTKNKSITYNRFIWEKARLKREPIQIETK